MPRPATPTYDDLILGGGAAGLSLLYHMRQAGLQRRVLLVDRQPVSGQDRTWCFWEREAGPFQAAVSGEWDHIWLNDPQRLRRLDIRPYRYKQLRGEDFHALLEDWLSTQSGVTRLRGEVQDVRTVGLGTSGQGAEVRVDGETYCGQWAYSSIPQPGGPLPTGHQHLLQHFRGWEIQTRSPTFDAAAATFMDFRVPQGGPGDLRFVYTLPASSTRALIEYTVFSPTLLPPEGYDAGLRGYLQDVLGLGEGDYRLLRQEGGVIPMTDAPPPLPTGRVIPIGTAGGMSKPSTGYTFLRIQRHSARLARQLAQHGHPLLPPGPLHSARHAWMDSVMLRALASGQEDGLFFGALFDRNPPARVLRFLDESSSLPADLALMLSVNVPRFVRLGLAVTLRRP